MEIQYTKYTHYRRKKFQIETSILEKAGKKYVRKRAVYPEGKRHVLHMLESEKKLKAAYDGVDICDVRQDGEDAVLFDFIEGHSYADLLRQDIDLGDMRALERDLKAYIGVLKSIRVETAPFVYSDAFRDIFGDMELENGLDAVALANLDATADNIIVRDGTPTVIDYEWVFDFPIPVDFVLYRNLAVTYFWQGLDFTKLLSFEELLNMCDIRMDRNMLEKMNQRMNAALEGGEGDLSTGQLMSRYMKGTIQQEGLGKTEGFVYFDTGDGFNESEKAAFPVLHNTLNVSLELPDNVRAFRLDPSAAEGLLLKDLIVEVDGIKIGPAYLSGRGWNGWYIFDRCANLFYETVRPVSMLQITGRIAGLNQELCRQFVREINENVQAQAHALEAGAALAARMKETDKEKSARIGMLEEAVEEGQQQLDSVLSSRAWQSVKRARKMMSALRRTGRAKAPQLETDGKIAEIATEWHTKAGEPISPVNVIYSIDKFRFEDGLLWIEGWMFPAAGMAYKLYLQLENEEKKERTELKYGMKREDVADALGNGGAFFSGFQGIVNVDVKEDALVYLVLENQRQYIPMFVQKIKAPCDAGKTGASFDIDLSPAMRVDTAAGFGSGLLQSEQGSVSRTERNDAGVMVDLILPVYNGYAYLEKLFTGVQKTNILCRIIAVDDCSPDERVWPYLVKRSEEIDGMVVIRNDTNMGFVRTVNKALRMAENHVVLLNTDIELPEGWLERLIVPVLEGAASATPFSNAATLLSFPKIGIDNPIMENLSVEEIDAQFRAITPAYTKLPTGVGFCMAMNKDALAEIGPFDEEAFARGYGEENDWCQRAQKAGYDNVAVENLFVYHKHGGSFQSAEKQRLVKQNMEVLLRRHPTYTAEVAAFFEVDPLGYLRNYIALKILSDKAESKPDVIWNHSLGGGADAYIRREIEKKLFSGERVVLVAYNLETGRYDLTYLYKEYELKLDVPDTHAMDAFFQISGVRDIVVNELVSYPNVLHILQYIVDMKSRNTARLTMLMHDFFCICPSCNLINDKGEYCGIPANRDVCMGCLKTILDVEDDAGADICVWRRDWREFLLFADEIRVFSQSSKDLLARAFGDLPDIVACPHKIESLPVVPKRFKTTDSLNIGLLGVLSQNKGQEIIRGLLLAMERASVDARVVLIGSLPAGDVIEDDRFIMTGPYERQDIPALVLEHDIDVFFISSIWPETFSYTAEEAMMMGQPVACFDIGAPAERIAQYEKGLVIDDINAAAAFEKIVNWVRAKKLLLPRQDHRRVLFVIEEPSFASRYRVEHFREQLLLHGIVGDIVKKADIGDVAGDAYDITVVYRCEYSAELERWIGAQHGQGRKVFYDIDDYVYNYDEIAYLGFLQGEEYKDFRRKCAAIAQCMQLCDGYLTSTETLRELILKDFPDKPVVVNRNVASMAMMVLSNEAMELVRKDGSKVVLGYFSGSHTHNADFDMVAGAIAHVLDRYPEARLHIGGCVVLPERLRPYENRITVMDFVGYTQLPELLAAVDINLMPLENTLFHQAKSENKWTEAALVGVPSVATKNAELSRVMEDGKTALFCSGEEDWKRALTELVENKALCREIGRAANGVALEKHTTLHTGDDAIALILPRDTRPQ